ncbi:MFS transporter [Streptomyces sp. MA5143a]|uniref:MFS transporter n=1 Tax=Streptomyces sp. MA5143a TaxID=2083010 RepID=UPI000D284768|nr:MFS transporter [Streptomyces sp. MA5143a]SPF05745.1 Glucose/mannose:H(+) symporter [Streptomyces sp. MA5143a]
MTEQRTTGAVETPREGPAAGSESRGEVEADKGGGRTGAGAGQVRLFSVPALVASCVGFALIGALQSFYGPAIPALREEFGLSPAAAGVGLTAHFIGGVGGVLAFNRVHDRVGNRLLLGVSYALMAAGSLGFALAPAWPPALAAAFVAGLGFGGIDYGLNQLFAVGFGSRSTAMLNVLNAFFGIGAVAGPALIGLLGSDRYTVVFAGCGLVSAALLLFLRGVRDRSPAPVRAPDGAADARPAAPARARVRFLLLAFVVLYVLHVGVEAGVGGWEPTHLESVGYGSAFAASATSVFWLMMTVGRFLVVPLTLRWPEHVIINISCAGMAVCLAAATVPALAPYMYAGVGLFIAPVFPTGLPWLTRTVPMARSASAHVIAASMLGGVAAGPALGAMIQWAGARSVPVVLCVIALLCLASSMWIDRTTRPRGQDQAASPRRR